MNLDWRGWLLVDQLKKFGLSVSQVLNIVIRVIVLMMLVGPSVGKMNRTGKLGQDWLKVFILNRWKLAKIHCGGCGKIEVAGFGLYLKPVIIWGEGILELFQMNVQR